MQLNLLTSGIAVVILVLAILLDLVLGDPSPNNPDRWVFKLHPTVLMGNFTKKIEHYFKNPDAKTEKFLGVLLGLTVIATFTVPLPWALGNLQFSALLLQHPLLCSDRHHPAQDDYMHQT